MGEANDLARKTEEVANRDVGQEETDGHNDSPRIREILAYCNLAPPSPYCASSCSMWVHTAALELGIVPELKKSGSAVHLWTNNPTLQIEPDRITAADLPVIGLNIHADKIHGHAFLCVGVDETTGRLTTIDPNSNANGGSEGTGIYLLQIRSTTDAQRLGYLRIA